MLSLTAYQVENPAPSHRSGIHIAAVIEIGTTFGKVIVTGPIRAVELKTELVTGATELALTDERAVGLQRIGRAGRKIILAKATAGILLGDSGSVDHPADGHDLAHVPAHHEIATGALGTTGHISPDGAPSMAHAPVLLESDTAHPSAHQPAPVTPTDSVSDSSAHTGHSPGAAEPPFGAGLGIGCCAACRSQVLLYRFQPDRSRRTR